MKILHTSDWHLGRMLHERSLIEDQKNALLQIHEIIKNNHHDALVIAGDIYDRSLPSADAVKLLSWFLVELRKISDINVIIVPGNHDSAERLSYCAELIAASNIYIQTDVMKVDTPIQIETNEGIADIYMIPFLDPTVYNLHSKNDESLRPTHESAVIKAISLINKGIDKKNINVFIGHLFTRGGMTSESERRFIGTAGDVDPGIFSEFDYVALGHLHKPQKVNDKVYFSGSPLKYSFSESGDIKQVLSVDIKKDSLKTEIIKIKPLRDMVRLKGKFSELMNHEKFKPHKEKYIEAEITDGKLITDPIASLRERFPNILSVRQSIPKAIKTEKNIKIIDEERSIEDDFMLFHEYIHDEKPPPEKIQLFADTFNESIK